MKKTIINVVRGLLCLFFYTHVQAYSNSTGLRVGDKMPDVTLNHLLNYSKTSVQFSEFSSKLIILDFWGTWCSSCIDAFPKTDSLQKQFGSKILVLGVAYEPNATVLAFFKRSIGPDHKPYRFPCVTDDTVLVKLFPHRTFPHYVWIGTDGYVKAITSAEEITTENIKNLLETKTLQVSQKDDIDPARPLFINEHVVMDSLTHYELIYHNSFDGPGTIRVHRETEGVVRGIAICNHPLLFIYETAAEELFKLAGDRYFPNRRILESKDSTYLKQNSWSRNHPIPDKKSLYNYDLIVPLASANRLYFDMLDDLNHNTSYFGKIEKRLINCLVLQRTSKVDKLASTSSNSVRNLDEESSIIVKNAPLDVFVIWLNNNDFIRSPVFNETAYKGKIDLQLNDVQDLKTLNDALQKYDLTLIPQKRMLTMFVISDKILNKHYPTPLISKP